MLVGTVVASQGVLFNVVALLEDGAVTAIRQKRELPNYGTFDEKRLFAPGPLPAPIDFRGVTIGVPICEAIWFPFVTAPLRAEGAEILLRSEELRVGKGCVRPCVFRWCPYRT